MEPKIIVLITMLALPNGDNGVHVKPMPTVDSCVAEASIEASDPFVRHVECSELVDGQLLLNFKREEDGATERGPDAKPASEARPRFSS